MGLFALRSEDLLRLGKTLKRVYGDRAPGIDELKAKFGEWAKDAVASPAPSGMVFSNPPSPTREELRREVSDAVAEVEHFLEELRTDYGKDYVEDLIRRWRS